MKNDAMCMYLMFEHALLGWTSRANQPIFPYTHYSWGFCAIFQKKLAHGDK
jgi:hypothetical protein